MGPSRTAFRRSWRCLWGLSFLLFALPLSAQEPKQTNSYEWERTEKLLLREGLEVHEAPEGKRIAWVRVVTDDVFAKDELWPQWFNWFHATTRSSVVRRELLFEEGGPYHDARIEETMRNLRGMGIFTLVRIVAVRTDDPQAVGVVVHTRDIWSLRIEQSFNVTNQLNELLVRIAERNLLGYNKTLGFDFLLVPKTYTLQPFYYARRVLNSRVSLSASAGPIFNRAKGIAEGSVWDLLLGEPFYNLKQRYSYMLDVAYDNRVVRQLDSGRVIRYAELDNGESVYQVYRRKMPAVSLSGYIRRGEDYKQTFGLGWDYREVRAFANRETNLPDSLRESFDRDILPKQRREIGPALSYEIWMPWYTTYVNLSTYGQSENVRLGPSALVSVRAPLSAFGSNSNSWVLAGTFGFVLSPRGGLVELKLGGKARYEEQRTVDQLASLMARAASPVLGYVRLVARGVLELRRRDTANTFVTLGADNGVRGYPSQAQKANGASRVIGNFEVRTLPLKWRSLHVGGVLFYDVGSVFASARDIQLMHAVGVGLRFLFPQFSRYPFAADMGFPLEPDFRFVPTLASSQVVPMTAYEDALLD